MFSIVSSNIGNQIFTNFDLFTASSEHSGIPTKKISGDLTGSSSGNNSSRSRYAALRDRRSRVARSKSSAVVGFGMYDFDLWKNFKKMAIFVLMILEKLSFKPL